MNKAIDITDLKKFIVNHQQNPELPIMTKAVVIDLLQLDKFITQAKSIQDCDAIKIYFIRYPLTSNKPHIEKIPGNNNLSQLSLAFVPANITNFSEWKVDDITDQNNQIFTLLVCDPTSSPSSIDKTGVCPPRGDCPPPTI